MDVREQIKSRLSITDVAGLYMDLKPAGKNLKALCPFHTEKNPSFIVWPETGTFRCFSCNKGGDIFTLVQEMENLSFPEAMNFLIEKFHIPVEKTGQRKKVPTDVYTRINEIALKYFKDNLYDTPEGKKALDYLRQRGISEDTIRLFSLGYAENKWDGLANHLRRQNCDMTKVVELGLLIRNPEKKSIYDRFRGRIIFPIFSEFGGLIAFGGRTIFDDTNKYLNSPDTPLYKKSFHLYGFNHAKNFIRENKHSILVEGYFDMVVLYQSGVKNAVASLGTALTENQIHLLKRFSETIYIFYDSDNAGVTAAVRGIEKMFEQNINPCIVATADAKDPDDFIRQKGLKAFTQLLDQATDGFKFLITNISQKYDLKIPEKKSQAIERMMSFIWKFKDSIIRDEYIRMAADFFQVDEKNLKLKDQRQAGAVSGEADHSQKRLDITPAERIFLQSILAMPELVDRLKGVFESETGLLSVLASRNIIRLLLDQINPETKNIEDYVAINEKLDEAERVEFWNIYNSCHRIEKDKTILEKKMEDSVSAFVEILNKQKFKQINQRIKIAERENNTEEVLKLLKEKSRHLKDRFNVKMNNTGGVVETL